MSIQVETHTPEANSAALVPGSKLLSGQYEIVRYLSSGGFGITYLAKDSLNRMVVIKECFPEAFCSRVNKSVRVRSGNYLKDFKSIVALFIREAHALSRLDHSGVVGVHQIFEDNETAYMALDLVDGKDLLEVIESGSPVMTPTQVRTFTLSLLDAIAHVHSQDLLHRDISPDNILVATSGRPVLIDFGAAREEASRKTRVLSAVLVVKDGYSPQEFYVTGSQQYPSSDLYALAASLVHLISGAAPPNSQARLAALASNQPDPYEPLLGRFSQYEPDFLAAIDTAMNVVPAKRLQSAEEWVLMIDPTKRTALARAQARDDQSIDLTISNLMQTMQEEPDYQVLEKDTAAPTVLSVAGASKDEEKIVDPKYDASFFEDLYQTEMPAGTEGLNDANASSGNTPTDVAQAQMEKVTVTPAAVVTTKSRIFKEEISTPRPVPKAGKVKSKNIKRKTLPEVISQQDFDTLLAAERSRVRSSNWRRLATIPVVLVACFMLGQAALKFEDVHTVTVGQLISIGQTFGYWSIDPNHTAGG